MKQRFVIGLLVVVIVFSFAAVVSAQERQPISMRDSVSNVFVRVNQFFSYELGFWLRNAYDYASLYGVYNTELIQESTNDANYTYVYATDETTCEYTVQPDGSTFMQCSDH